MGTPDVYLGWLSKFDVGFRIRQTHTGAQHGRILPVVGDDDEPVRKFTPGPQRERKGTNVLAASARTFSRNWQAPPPLMQFKFASTLWASYFVSAHADVILHLLVRTVDGDIEF
jgi:hypothetical protein